VQKHQSEILEADTSAELPFLTWYVHTNTSCRRCRYVGFDNWCKLS